MRKKYLVLLLVPLVIALAGCGKKHFAPPPTPGSPSNLTATAVSYNQINLFWQDNSDIEDGFKVCCDMGTNQYQIIAILGPNATQFEHPQLQPMTEYRYYVQSYRGEEHANSEEASATTPCPVEFVDWYIARGSMRYFEVRGVLSSNASESCRVELTACLYHPDTGDLVGIATYTVDMGPVNKYMPFSFEVYLVTETAGDVDPDRTLEITDVEIEY